MTKSAKQIKPSVFAAGVLLWRRQKGILQIAMVHRPAYNDWSWPKGKLDAGESSVTAAFRETAEETGFTCRIGIPLPTSYYQLSKGRIKQVRYWAAQPTNAGGELEHEVDEIAWVDAHKAGEKLTYPWDGTLAAAMLNADAIGALDTWPLLLVRHSWAGKRKKWDGDDLLRPLTKPGKQRAQELSNILTAYDIKRLVSSPAVRCVDTLAPYAQASGQKLFTKKGLSEPGHIEKPQKVAKHVHKTIAGGLPAAICTHGPVIPDFLRTLAEYAEPRIANTLQSMARKGLVKGEILLAHVHGAGPTARIVALDRQQVRKKK